MMNNCKVSYCCAQFRWTMELPDTFLPVPKVDLWPLGVAMYAILSTRGRIWKSIWIQNGIKIACPSIIMRDRTFPKWITVRMRYTKLRIQLFCGCLTNVYVFVQLWTIFRRDSLFLLEWRMKSLDLVKFWNRSWRSSIR